MVELMLGDCLDILPEMDIAIADAVIADIPYGTTAKKWDSVLPFDEMWEGIYHVIKPGGVIVLFGKQPFFSRLVASNIERFRYEIIWRKDKGTDFGNANRKPLNIHENIGVWYDRQPTYNKQMLPGKPYTKKNYRNNDSEDLNYKSDNSGVWINTGERTPTTVITIARDNIHKGKSVHPTQKPVALMEYLIKTYTNEGDTVLDFTMGSGSTGVAANHLNRHFIGIEKDPHYYEIARSRIC